MDKYRFTLQFPKESPEQTRAGEFLSKLGRKKSLVIVAAINEYLDNHPELVDGEASISVKVANSMDEAKLKQMISQVFKEEFSGVMMQDVDKTTNVVADSMLDGLDAFL